MTSCCEAVNKSRSSYISTYNSVLSTNTFPGNEEESSRRYKLYAINTNTVNRKINCALNEILDEKFSECCTSTADSITSAGGSALYEIRQLLFQGKNINSTIKKIGYVICDLDKTLNFILNLLKCGTKCCVGINLALVEFFKTYGYLSGLSPSNTGSDKNFIDNEYFNTARLFLKETMKSLFEISKKSKNCDCCTAASSAVVNQTLTHLIYIITLLSRKDYFLLGRNNIVKQVNIEVKSLQNIHKQIVESITKKKYKCCTEVNSSIARIYDLVGQRFFLNIGGMPTSPVLENLLPNLGDTFNSLTNDQRIDIISTYLESTRVIRQETYKSFNIILKDTKNTQCCQSASTSLGDGIVVYSDLIYNITIGSINHIVNDSDTSNLVKQINYITLEFTKKYCKFVESILNSVLYEPCNVENCCIAINTNKLDFVASMNEILEQFDTILLGTPIDNNKKYTLLLDASLKIFDIAFESYYCLCKVAKKLECCEAAASAITITCSTSINNIIDILSNDSIPKNDLESKELPKELEFLTKTLQLIIKVVNEDPECCVEIVNGLKSFGGTSLLLRTTENLDNAKLQKAHYSSVRELQCMILNGYKYMIYNKASKECCSAVSDTIYKIGLNTLKLLSIFLTREDSLSRPVNEIINDLNVELEYSQYAIDVSLEGLDKCSKCCDSVITSLGTAVTTYTDNFSLIFQLQTLQQLNYDLIDIPKLFNTFVKDTRILRYKTTKDFSVILSKAQNTYCCSSSLDMAKILGYYVELLSRFVTNAQVINYTMDEILDLLNDHVLTYNKVITDMTNSIIGKCCENNKDNSECCSIVNNNRALFIDTIRFYPVNFFRIKFPDTVGRVYINTTIRTINATYDAFRNLLKNSTDCCPGASIAILNIGITGVFTTSIISIFRSYTASEMIEFLAEVEQFISNKLNLIVKLAKCNSSCCSDITQNIGSITETYGRLHMFGLRTFSDPSKQGIYRESIDYIYNTVLKNLLKLSKYVTNKDYCFRAALGLNSSGRSYMESVLDFIGEYFVILSLEEFNMYLKRLLKLFDASQNIILESVTDKIYTCYEQVINAAAETNPLGSVPINSFDKELGITYLYTQFSMVKIAYSVYLKVLKCTKDESCCNVATDFFGVFSLFKRSISDIIVLSEIHNIDVKNIVSYINTIYNKYKELPYIFLKCDGYNSFRVNSIGSFYITFYNWIAQNIANNKVPERFDIYFKNNIELLYTSLEAIDCLVKAENQECSMKAAITIPNIQLFLMRIIIEMLRNNNTPNIIYEESIQNTVNVFVKMINTTLWVVYKDSPCCINLQNAFSPLEWNISNYNTDEITGISDNEKEQLIKFLYKSYNEVILMEIEAVKTLTKKDIKYTLDEVSCNVAPIVINRGVSTIQTYISKLANNEDSLNRGLNIIKSGISYYVNLYSQIICDTLELARIKSDCKLAAFSNYNGFMINSSEVFSNFNKSFDYYYPGNLTDEQSAKIYNQYANTFKQIVENNICGMLKIIRAKKPECCQSAASFLNFGGIEYLTGFNKELESALVNSLETENIISRIQKIGEEYKCIIQYTLKSVF